MKYNVNINASAWTRACFYLSPSKHLETNKTLGKTQSPAYIYDLNLLCARKLKRLLDKEQSTKLFKRHTEYYHIKKVR